MERDHLKPGPSDANPGSVSRPADAASEESAVEMRIASDVPVDPAGTPAAPVGEPDEFAALRHALLQLPPAYRMAIEVRSLSRRPFEELAQKLNRSTDDARKLWFGALIRLQQEIKKYRAQHEAEQNHE